MNPIFLLAAANPGAENPLQEIARSFGFDLHPFISSVISFCIVAWALHRWAYKPVLHVLEERRQKIAESLANAEQIKKDLAAAQSKAQDILTAANAQAAKMIEASRGDAQRVGDQEKQKAIAEAADIIAKARQAAEAERARMLTEVRREVGRLVVATTSKVTGKILTPEDQQRLAEETNRQLAA